MEQQPFVSVVVITYNSSATVLETLDSIKEQTYQNLELIISDDCSKDNTIDVCRKWLGLHLGRFRNVEIVTTPVNTGIAANLNRAESKCHTEWVKNIAADDLLEKDCIKNNMEYVLSHPNAIYIFSKVLVFGNSQKQIDYFDHFFDYNFFMLNPQEQLDRLVKKGNCIPAPSFFYNLKKKRELSLAWDERIPLLEDLPMWINALQKGIRFHFLNKVTALYRVGEKGLTSGRGNPLSVYSGRLFRLLYVFPYEYKEDPLLAAEHVIQYINDIEMKFLKSKSYRLGQIITFPFHIVIKVINRIF